MEERRFGPVRFIPGERNGKYPYCHSLYLEDQGGLIDPSSDRDRLTRLRKDPGVKAVWLSHWHEDHLMHLGLFDDLPLWMSEQEPGRLWDDYVNGIFQREERLLSLLGRPRDRQEIVEAWIVYGKAREPRYFFEFGEWAILEKHLDRLVRQGRVACAKGKYVRLDGS